MVREERGPPRNPHRDRAGALTACRGFATLRILRIISRRRGFFVASMAASTTDLRKTSLNETHHKMGARMVPFGGWDMAAEESGIVAEHMAGRTRAGLFDVRHMGR